MLRSLQKLFSSSSKNQKIPKLNQNEPEPTPNENALKIILGMTVAMIFAKTAVPEFRAIKTMEKLSDYKPTPKRFAGVQRASSSKALSSSLNDKPVLVYAPHRSGLSSAVQSFCSEQQHCLTLNTRGPWAEELNEVGLPVTFSFYDYRLMTLLIGKLVHKFQDLVFILDGFENLAPNEKKYLARLLRTKAKIAGKFLVTSADLSALREMSQVVDSHFLALPEVTLEEMHLILKEKPGYKADDVDSLWIHCGSDLESALDMVGQGRGWEFFADTEEKRIRGQVEDILKSSQLREPFLAALGSPNHLRPLGSLYFDSPLAEELAKRRLVKGLDLDAYCFRNKFVLKSIIKEVQEKTTQDQVFITGK